MQKLQVHLRFRPTADLAERQAGKGAGPPKEEVESAAEFRPTAGHALLAEVQIDCTGCSKEAGNGAGQGSHGAQVNEVVASGFVHSWPYRAGKD